MAKNISGSNTGYTRSYSDIAGVELGGSGSGISKNRLAYAENVYRDYSGDGSGLIESVPGYRRIVSLGEKIHELYLQKCASGGDHLLIHAGNNLYRMKISERDSYMPDAPIARLESERSCFFPHGDSVYLINGGTALRISPDGSVLSVPDEAEPYVPTLHLNGKVFEQRNLLTDGFREEYICENPTEYTYGTPGIRYKIIDPTLGTCAVTGISKEYVGTVYVPAVTSINGKTYKVVEICNRAFSHCTLITEVYIAEGVELIGEYAFRFCIRLKKAVVPRSVIHIKVGAFGDCYELEDMYLGSGVAQIGNIPFSGCKVLKKIYYGGNEANIETITNYTVLSDFEIIPDAECRHVALLLPLSCDAEEISSVSENGVESEFELVTEGGRISGVVLTSDIAWDKRCDFVITGTLTPYSADLGAADPTSTPSAIDAVLGCTVAEVFDGRVFLSGNPQLPNTVFYSSNSTGRANAPLYFGVHDYFTDGIGSYPVKAMLAVRDSLAIFKSGDDGSGSIFYHTSKSTGEDYAPRIYPVSYVHSGICAVGEALSFLDDPVFITAGGIYALTQKAINYERSVVCRSHNVNYDLLRESLENASMTEWQGYLVIGIGDRAYLADSRAVFNHEIGNAEYEWFVMKGLGSYENSTRVYRYDSYSTSDFKAHPTPGEVARGEVYSTVIDGTAVFYVNEDGCKYTVYPTEEMTGGDFSPATVYLGCEELLFFGTSSGALMVFNNDKRGIAPDWLSAAPDFDPEEYEATMGRSIHPLFYSFDSHAPRYAIKTASDDCDIPHLTKSTVKHSLVLKCKSRSCGQIRCEVGTERSGYSEITHFPGAELNFAELNFEELTLTTSDYQSLPIAEKEKGWVEKQITLYSDKFASPMGIFSLAYRYTVKGKIRKS